MGRYLLFIWICVCGSSLFVLGQDNIEVVNTDGYACTLKYLDREFQCSLGRNGVTQSKEEGDGCTPVGSFPLRRVFYRPDRVPAPTTPLLLNATKPNFGWCDDGSSDAYNQFELLPDETYSHEELWLDGSYYDTMAVIGYNDDPVVVGAGSAIFFHVTPDYGSTSGCVAMALEDLTWVLANVTEATLIEIS
jgi:L,D-peptidoglycan transpeptidase YkuD (ErfK/YbiS/YcfS/YnhG family)